jgi:hypothetical protein
MYRKKWGSDKIMGYIDVIAHICREIDALYVHAMALIPPNKTHDLGYNKELVKGIVEELITALFEEVK